jgi:hypothetical protein
VSEGGHPLVQMMLGVRHCSFSDKLYFEFIPSQLFFLFLGVPDAAKSPTHHIAPPRAPRSITYIAATRAAPLYVIEKNIKSHEKSSFCHRMGSSHATPDLVSSSRSNRHRYSTLHAFLRLTYYMHQCLCRDYFGSYIEIFVFLASF